MAATDKIQVVVSLILEPMVKGPIFLTTYVTKADDCYSRPIREPGATPLEK